MSKAAKITPFRRSILEAAASERGSLCPSGQRDSGPHASRWWGAARWLVNEGLAVRSQQLLRATDKGRALLGDLSGTRQI